MFLASAQAAHEQVPLSPEQTAQVAAFNDEGKTVSVLLVALLDQAYRLGLVVPE